MKKAFQLILALPLMMLFLSGTSRAEIIYTYNDEYINWPGQQAIYPQDEYGWPKLQSVTITLDNDRSLSSVSFSMQNFGQYTRQIPDALFINNDWNGTTADWQSWDYYVYDTNREPKKGESLYSVADDYTYTYNNKSGRVGHANGIEPADLTPIAGLDEIIFDYTSDPQTATLNYIFNDNAIYLDKNFIVGYTPWCANDVFATPVPEGNTAMFLGAMFLGLGIFGRRRLLKKHSK
jgi:hypothetical protein